MIDDLSKYIMNREDIPKPLFSVKAILEMYGMGNYSEMCCDRIAEAMLIDGKYVNIDYLNVGDLLIDKVGIIKCEDILLDYIHLENIDKLEDYVYLLSDSVREKNNYLTLLRRFPKKKLRELIKEVKDNRETVPNWEQFMCHFRLELKSRRFLYRKWITVRNKLEDVWLEIRYYPLIRLVKQIAGRTMEENLKG